MPINFKTNWSVNSMATWEVTKLAAEARAAQCSYKGKSTDTKESYSKILAEKISNVEADVKQMEETQAQLDELEQMQKELTGGNSIIPCVETVKRFMPDGSIMVTTYTDGELTSRVYHKPHMISVPDYNAPPKADGTVATKLEATQSFDLALLLM